MEEGKGKKRKCDGAPPHGAGPKKKKADVASGSDTVFGGASNPYVASCSDAVFGGEGASPLEGEISASNGSPDSKNPAILSGGSGKIGRMLQANAAGCEDVSADEDPEALEALVVVPPCIGRAQRAVDFHEFSRGLREALFGPLIEWGRRAFSSWRDTSEVCVPCTAFFTTGGDEAVLAPPVGFAVVHLRRDYITYRASHAAGLARLSHGTTAMRGGANHASIRAAVQRLLTPAQREPSHPACVRCSEPADWQTACCSLTLCSYCLPRELVMRHRGVSVCTAREGGGTLLRQLRGPRAPERHGPEWVCTRQLLVQIEEEQFGKSVLKDIFLFRTFTYLEDLESLAPSRRHTDFYHMQDDGALRRVRTIRGAQLAFLW